MTEKHYLLERGNVVDNCTTPSAVTPLSANQGMVLNARIDNLASIGRFLSLWNCATGLPTTNPATIPYTYHTGDYYIITVTGDTNYKPNGSSYTGSASTTVAQEYVQTGDIWRYDGTTWSFESNHAVSSGVADVLVNNQSVLVSGVARIPNASSTVTGTITANDWSRFNAKQDGLITGSNVSISNNVISVEGTSSVTSDGTGLISQAGLYKRIQSGTELPQQGFIGTPSIGDIYIRYEAV